MAGAEYGVQYAQADSAATTASQSFPTLEDSSSITDVFAVIAAPESQQRGSPE